MRPKELLLRNGKEELQKVAIEIRIAFLVGGLGGERVAGELTPQSLDRGEAFLKSRSRAKETRSPRVSPDGSGISIQEISAEPFGRVHRACGALLTKE
jgi:hypothetical protein